MLQNCVGVEHHTPHECNTSTFASNKRLIGGGTLGNYPTTSAANMLLVPTSTHGAKTMDMHQ